MGLHGTIGAPTRGLKRRRRIAPRRWFGILPLVAVAAAGCQLRIATDINLGPDGRGALEVAVGLDEELARALDDAGVDVLRGLERARAAADGWQVIEEPAGSAPSVRLRAAFDDADAFAELAGSLHAGLGDDDPRIHRDLAVVARPDGSVEVRGAAGLRLPSTTGAEGAGVTFDADDLDVLLAERGDEFVRVDLRVTLPSAPAAHDADEVDGRTLRWRLPVGSLRAFHARSEPVARTPFADAAWLPWAVGVTVTVATAAVVVGAGRRVRAPSRR